MSELIPPHGGYEKLQSWQMAVIVHDGTVEFYSQHISLRSRTHDQMVQADRSGKQNIAEGSMASGASKKTELKLVGIARASLEELLNDYRDFLRHHTLQQWEKDNPKAIKVRSLCYQPNRSYQTYQRYIVGTHPEVAANTMICVIHQTNYLLDQQLRQLDSAFLKEGGFTERLYRKRKEARGGP